jgi:hypothetical protein
MYIPLQSKGGKESFTSRGHRYNHDMPGNKSKIRNHNMVMNSKGQNLPRTEENLKSSGQ